MPFFESIENKRFIMKTTFKFFTLAVLSYSPILVQASPDVLGISLGMTPDQVSKEIREYANEQKLRPLIRTINLSARNPATGRTVALPNGKFVAQYSVGEARQDISGADGKDELSVNFTPTPGNEQVAAIYRRVGFNPGMAPSNANLFNDLKKKYGTPSFESPASQSLHKSMLIWSFDSSGKLSKNFDATRCAVKLPIPTAYVLSPTSPEHSWEEHVLKSWPSLQAYYDVCGTTLLSIRTDINARIGAVQRMYVSLHATKAIIDAQRQANDLMQKGDESAKSNAIKGAESVKSPRL